MGRKAVWLLAGALLFQGCGKEQPVTVRDAQMGITIVFPGQPSRVRYSEPTPFGAMEWFGQAWHPGGRMDTNFQVEVANLPPGTQGGTTPDEVVATYRRWLQQRFGTLDSQELPASKGPGLRYGTTSPMGTHLQGILVVRRGRLHRAEVTVPQVGDPRAGAFLESYEVQF